MIKAAHKETLGLPREHDLVEIKKPEWETNEDGDIGTYHYEHIDADGNIVAQYVVKDAMGVEPPCERVIYWEKVS